MQAGMRVNDRIIQINDTPADNLTLMEACELIRRSGRHVRIYVKGDGWSEGNEQEYTVTLWYTLRKSIAISTFGPHTAVLECSNARLILSVIAHKKDSGVRLEDLKTGRC